MSDVLPPIYSRSRQLKTKCQVQAEMKNTASLPKCHCQLCSKKPLNFGFIDSEIVLADNSEKHAAPDENSEESVPHSPPNLLVCPYKNLWVDQFRACCCTTIHESNKQCSQTWKDYDKKYHPCFCPRCCFTCMRTITLNKDTFVKEDCVNCARKYFTFVPCIHFRGYCEDG